MDLYFSDHLCFFQTLEKTNNHVTEKSLSFAKRLAINLRVHLDYDLDPVAHGVLKLKKLIGFLNFT